MNFTRKYYPEINFGGFTRIDGTVEFYSRVNSIIKPDFTVLDLGCGRGEYQEDTIVFRKNLRILRGKCKKVIGVDVDPSGEHNPYIDEFYKSNGLEIPLGDKSIDLCVCDWVLEHIDDPEKFFCEIKRVLKNGGIFCVRTVNKCHYVSLASQLLPDKYHQKILSIVQPGRKDIDIFPKHYRCNTIGKMKKIFSKLGSNYTVYSIESEPAYLNISIITYGLGVLLQQITLPQFRLQIIGFVKIETE